MARTIDPAVAHTRAVVSSTKRDHARGLKPESAVTEAVRNHRAAYLADHVRRVLAEWPPLSDAQLDRIAALLRAGTK